MSESEKHLAAAKSRLLSLAGIAAKTEATERNILAAAEARLKLVQADLDRLAPRVNLDPAAADQYVAATTEIGHLRMVIARAIAALGGAA
ncbi:MAG: hypothetical protein GC191_09160 [Azospirillum sp.]|nr:hypothetical protein [Azospirillum sp.]